MVGRHYGIFKKEGDGYVGAMILENRNSDSADSLTLPITFTHIAGVQGEWAFNLSVNKLPSEEIDIVQTVSSFNNEYSIQIKEMNIGQTNAILSYEVLNTASLKVNIYILILLTTTVKKLHSIQFLIQK